MGTCEGDAFTDCAGECIPGSLISWQGDGYCDDGAWGVFFDCDEFKCEARDCFDECGVCRGDSTSCADECGVPNGDKSS